MNTLQYNDRFKDAPWYEKCLDEKILLCGLGGIGSSSLYCLTKTIPATYYIIDYDMVDSVNVGCQFFNKNDVGKPKVIAITEMAKSYSTANIVPLNRKITDGDYMPITISAFDNMSARKQLFDNWKSKDSRELFIDGRLRANYYEVYVVLKGKEEQYEATLFNDNEVEDDACTFKQTAYFAMMIGSKITQVLTNYLSNKYNGNDVCILPFKVSEVGEVFYFNTI